MQEIKGKQVQCIYCLNDIPKEKIAAKKRHWYRIDKDRHSLTTYVCKCCARLRRGGIVGSSPTGSTNGAIVKGSRYHTARFNLRK